MGVIDAGSKQMNGFYVRRENSEGPPDPSLYGADESDYLTSEDRKRWLKSMGRQWYQKEDDGSHITFYDVSFGWDSDDPDKGVFKGSTHWYITAINGDGHYGILSGAAEPPA